MTNSWPVATTDECFNKKVVIQTFTADTRFFLKCALIRIFWVQDDSPIPLDIIATDSPSLPKLNSGVG